MRDAGRAAHHFVCSKPRCGVFSVGVHDETVEGGKRILCPFPDLTPVKVRERSRGIIPFGFGGQAALCPRTVGLGIIPRNMNRWRLHDHRRPGAKCLHSEA